MDLFQTQTQDEQSSQLDIHVSHFHLPGSAEAQKMTDISGRTYFPLFKPDDQLFAFSKTFMATSLWASTKCYLTWKVRATPQGRSLFQLVPLTHLTDETEFGLSPEMWPTATARDYKGGRMPETLAKAGRNETNSLPDAVNAQMGKTGSLNPQWVEWLMGYPEGWTDLED